MTKINDFIAYVKENKDTIRPVPGFLDIYADDQGHIYKVSHKDESAYEISQYDNGIGYRACAIRSKMFYVHRIVALAFGKISDYHESVDIDHINGIRYDNRIDNLQPLSHADNIAKRAQDGAWGVSTTLSCDGTVAKFNTIKDAADYLAVKCGGIHDYYRILYRISCGKRKSHIIDGWFVNFDKNNK